jgi:hypothetical protein
MTDDILKSSLADFDILHPPLKLRDSSRMLPLTGRSVLDIHHIAAHIFAVITDTPALPFDYIKFRGDYFRFQQNPRRIVAITETTKKAFKGLDKAERYSIESALFFPAIDLSGGIGMYELVFLGIPYYDAESNVSSWIRYQQMLGSHLLESLKEILRANAGSTFTAVMIEPCIVDKHKSMKFEVPQARLDAYSPLPAEKYVPPPEIAEKILKQLPRKNDTDELTGMIRNTLLLCEQRDDPAWKLMVMNDVI